MIDLRYPLGGLAKCMPWSEIEESLAQLLDRNARVVSMKLDVGMFGLTAVVFFGWLRRRRPSSPAGSFDGAAVLQARLQ